MATRPKAARQSTPKSELRGRFASDERTQTPARGSQIVETLRGRFAGETLGTFQLDDTGFFHEDIGKAVSHGLAAARMPRRRSSWSSARW